MLVYNLVHVIVYIALRWEVHIQYGQLLQSSSPVIAQYPNKIHVALSVVCTVQVSTPLSHDLIPSPRGSAWHCLNPHPQYVYVYVCLEPLC